MKIKCWMLMIWIPLFCIKWCECSLTKTNHFVKVLKYSSNSSDMIHTGGRLMERHLEYLAISGYKSVLSVVTFPNNDTIYNGVNGSFPSSDYEKYLLESKYDVEMKYLASNLTKEYAYLISELIEIMPKPIYVHCHVGWTASLFTSLHTYITTTTTTKLYPSSSDPSLMTSTDIYNFGLELGYDYRSTQNSIDLINAVTKSNDTIQPPIIESTLVSGESSYKYYYWTHRAGDSDNWYNSGQILSSHLEAIASAGYRSIISFRASGEETIRLESDPTVGYIPNNEFSDENGLYQSYLEEKAITSISLSHSQNRASSTVYYNLPLPSGSALDWTMEQFLTYLPILSSIEKSSSPVLAHCASGYRSAAYVLAYIGYTTKKCTDWAIEKAREIGFDYDSSDPSTTDTQIINFFHEILQC